MNVLKPNKRATILTLLERGKSQREIARLTGIDRKTVKGYRERWLAEGANSPGVATGSEVAVAPPGQQTPPPWPPAGMPVATSRCEPHRDFIEAQVRLGRNGVAIYQDLVDQHGFAGAYNSVKRFVAKLRHEEPERFDRLSFLPGEEMQVDYGEGAPTRVPGTDRYRKPRLFVATLRYSRRSFRRVVWKSSQQVWAELHEQAWRYFGGSCRYVVLDNLKEGVLKPDLYEPELNPVFAATLAHYEVVADPARVRDPNRKGTVESAIGHTQATALKGKRFETIEAQNEHLERWETRWAAQRIHGTERRQVQAMFEDERAHLQRLPLTGMQYFKQEERTVCDDGCVRVDHSSYSARPMAIGAKVLVRIFERRIEIRELTTGRLVRTHERAERPGTVVMPQAERVFNPSRETRFILKQADQIGPQAARLCRMLFGIEGRVGQRKLHGIVNLSRRYPSRFVNAACAAAIEQGIHSYKHVKALTERLVAEALASIDAAGDGTDPGRADLAQEHVLIRDTEEYGSLFNLAATQAGVDTSEGGGL
ncbi:IS21 family transposase [Pseudomonas aeruginosa]|uniref:IS21 family transposase n=1 Tax=Pseudomonas aeruginosa TaxID=287 RepID=UPI000539DD99|nr:IS21 family transposase [Pseudomonas aeruginosa]MBH9282525.1 IS21 family transposase [Pseudomonas aeruginosa]MDU5677507.1 IS21 family transposase [Pseudomonas aeruginosa]NPY51997.1 IS21 family transposase [Pseudomonas aeruginosa]NPZ37040.1 IS21 family transposase [Pseudomonas aeruginosa]NQB82044.1 IS21 family transposase [Pseudomonas aeruginosa]